MPYYPIGQFLPDLEAFENPGTPNVKNVLPHARGFIPIKELATIDSVSASITPTAVVSAFSFMPPSGDPYAFLFSGNLFWYSFIEGVGGTNAWQALNSVTVATVCNFVKFGTAIIASRGAAGANQGPLRSSLSTTPSNFTALGGSPPNAALVAIVRDFVVFARTDTDTGQLVWSALGNPEDYVASATTQADSQIIGDEGPILCIVGGEYGIIIFSNAVYRMSYIGSPAIFQFDKISSGFQAAEERLGQIATRHGDDVYFWLKDGIAVIRSGQLFQRISDNRTAQFVRARQGSQISPTPNNSHIVAADVANGRIIGAFNQVGGGTSLGAILYYDIGLDRFSYASLAVNYVFTGIGARVRGGGELFFDGNMRMQRRGSISATNMACFVDTAEIEPTPKRRSHLINARPAVEGVTQPRLQIGHRRFHNESVSFGATVSANVSGDYPFRINDRLFRARINMAQNATWSLIYGMDWDFVPGDDR